MLTKTNLIIAAINIRLTLMKWYEGKTSLEKN